MIPPPSFNVSRSNGSATLAIAGDIDIATASELANVLNDFAHESVTVDLSAVTFMDSSGLATLSDAHQRITRAGGQFAIDGARPQVQRIFEITGLFLNDSLHA